MSLFPLLHKYYMTVLAVNDEMKFPQNRNFKRMYLPPLETHGLPSRVWLVLSDAAT